MKLRGLKKSEERTQTTRTSSSVSLIGVLVRSVRSPGRPGLRPPESRFGPVWSGAVETQEQTLEVKSTIFRNDLVL